jgi:hypothetical protein
VGGKAGVRGSHAYVVVREVNARFCVRCANSTAEGLARTFIPRCTHVHSLAGCSLGVIKGLCTVSVSYSAAFAGCARPLHLSSKGTDESGVARREEVHLETAQALSP